MDTREWLNLTSNLSDVDTWAKPWSVHDNPFPHIRCRICAGYQQVQDSARPFVHIPACKLLNAQGSFPWQDVS
jgi:hypothetical protein